MREVDVHPATDRLVHARIAIVAYPSSTFVTIEQRLHEAGAIVRRVSPGGAGRAVLTGEDAAIVHLSGEPGELERLALLAAQQRVIALFDDFPEAAVLGVRDFIVAPFRPSEVLARLDRALMEPSPDGVLQAGNLRLDTATRLVIIDQRPTKLTFGEFELLHALLLVKGVVLSRDELKHHIGRRSNSSMRATDLLVHRLRMKLDGWVGGQLETVRNVGYRVTRG